MSPRIGSYRGSKLKTLWINRSAHSGGHRLPLGNTLSFHDGSSSIKKKGSAWSTFFYGENKDKNFNKSQKCWATSTRLRRKNVQPRQIHWTAERSPNSVLHWCKLELKMFNSNRNFWIFWPWYPHKIAWTQHYFTTLCYTQFRPRLLVFFFLFIKTT